MIVPVVAVSAGLCAALVTTEVVLRTFPRLLPPWFRETLPVGGAELITPGILARTPIDGVPLPYGFNHRRMMAGSVPRDLVSKGLVAPEDNPDVARYKQLRYRFDRFGFINPREMASAEILLVGDSFVVATGILEPAGLQAKLHDETGREIFNLSVPAIGPMRERWLLEEVGLALNPRAVVWFFFGGNDLSDARNVARHLREGVRTYADRVSGYTRPRSLTLGLVGAAIRNGRRDRENGDSLPGLVFETRTGVVPVWFFPSYLRNLGRPRDKIASSPEWSAASDTLLGVSRLLGARQIDFLLVYVPTKAQVYLPAVRKDRDLVYRMASHDRPLRIQPEDFLSRSLENRGALEALLSDFCDDHEIEYLSLTPLLTELAADGQLGYLSADTHWNEVGQAVAVAPLRSWIEDHSTLERDE